MPDLSPPDPWVSVVTLLLGGGGLKYAYDAFKDWRNRPPRELRAVGIVDANIATVVRARDELEEDNKRLRQTLNEERKQRAEDESRHAVERMRWLADQDRYRADITRLEAQIRTERDDAAARYDALLETVHRLRLRADVHEIEEGNS